MASREPSTQNVFVEASGVTMGAAALNVRPILLRTSACHPLSPIIEAHCPALQARLGPNPGVRHRSLNVPLMYYFEFNHKQVQAGTYHLSLPHDIN